MEPLTIVSGAFALGFAIWAGISDSRAHRYKREKEYYQQEAVREEARSDHAISKLIATRQQLYTLALTVRTWEKLPAEPIKGQSFKQTLLVKGTAKAEMLKLVRDILDPDGQQIAAATQYNPSQQAAASPQ